KERLRAITYNRPLLFEEWFADLTKSGTGYHSALQRKKRMSIRSRSKRGFTMMELLIVVTIIAILASILLPIVSSFRRSARVAAAKQAMNAITMALDKYKEDFESYPPDNAPSSNGSEILYWHLCRRIVPKVRTPD